MGGVDLITKESVVGTITSGHRLLVALLLAGAVLDGCGKGGTPAPPPLGVLVAPALEKTVQDWDEYTGKFAAIDSVEVRPRVSGYIDKVLFKEGSIVQEGDILVQIDPRPYQADANRARAEWMRAKTQLALAHIELDRVQKLKDSLSDFLNVFDAERDALDAETSVAQSNTEVATNLIALYKALGGAWEGVASASPDKPGQVAGQL